MRRTAIIRSPNAPHEPAVPHALGGRLLTVVSVCNLVNRRSPHDLPAPVLARHLARPAPSGARKAPGGLHAPVLAGHEDQSDYLPTPRDGCGSASAWGAPSGKQSRQGSRAAAWRPAAAAARKYAWSASRSRPIVDSFSGSARSAASRPSVRTRRSGAAGRAGASAASTTPPAGGQAAGTTRSAGARATRPYAVRLWCDTPRWRGAGPPRRCAPRPPAGRRARPTALTASPTAVPEKPHAVPVPRLPGPCVDHRHVGAKRVPGGEQSAVHVGRLQVAAEGLADRDHAGQPIGRARPGSGRTRPAARRRRS